MAQEIQFQAIFDGTAVRPLGKVPLEKGDRLTVTAVREEEPQSHIPSDVDVTHRPDGTPLTPEEQALVKARLEALYSVAGCLTEKEGKALEKALKKRPKFHHRRLKL